MLDLQSIVVATMLVVRPNFTSDIVNHLAVFYILAKH